MRKFILAGAFLLASCVGPCFERDSKEFATPACIDRRLSWDIVSGQKSLLDMVVSPNTYGLDGIDATGKPVRLRPAFAGPAGNYSNSFVQTPNAYGPGIHMDQYGRAVSY